MDKEFNEKNAFIAMLLHKVNFLERKLKSKQRTRRKAVNCDPNRTFARIPEIAYARWEAEKAPKEYRDKQARNLQD